jgi:single-stranded-DNA-specific exonuclease
MEKMGPFGIGNPRPIVQVMRAKVREVYAMGNKGTHLSLKVGGERIRCVWWGQGELVEKIACGSRVDIVVKIKANEFRGHHSAEIEIIDLKLPSA